MSTHAHELMVSPREISECSKRLTTHVLVPHELYCTVHMYITIQCTSSFLCLGSTVRHMLSSRLAAWNTLTPLLSRRAVWQTCLSVGNPGKKMSSFTPGIRPGTSLSRVMGNGMAGSSEHLLMGEREGEGGREGGTERIGGAGGRGRDY